jgi:hypothetical protein
MIKLKSNIFLNKINNFLSIIILWTTPNNNLKHSFQSLKKTTHLISKANIYFQFLIRKNSILPRKFFFKNTSLQHTSIKRYHNSFLINQFLILNLFLFQILYTFQLLFQLFRNNILKLLIKIINLFWLNIVRIKNMKVCFFFRLFQFIDRLWIIKTQQIKTTNFLQSINCA